MLWHTYKNALCDDLQWHLKHYHSFHASVDQVHDYGLYLLQMELAVDSTKMLAEIGLTNPIEDWDHLLGHDLLRQHSCYDHGSELHSLLTCLPLLNNEQRDTFNKILNVIVTGQSQLFFIEGAAGAGKMFLYNALCHTLRSQNLIILCVASSPVRILLKEIERKRKRTTTFIILWSLDYVHFNTFCC